MSGNFDPHIKQNLRHYPTKSGHQSAQVLHCPGLPMVSPKGTLEQLPSSPLQR